MQQAIKEAKPEMNKTKIETNPFVFFTDDGTIGDLSDELFFSLIKSKRLGRKILLIRFKQYFYYFYLFLKKIGLKKEHMIAPLKAIYRLESPQFISKKRLPYYLILSLYYDMSEIVRRIVNKVLRLIGFKITPYKNKIGDIDDIYNINCSTSFSTNEINQIHWGSFLEKKPPLYFSKSDINSCKRQLKTLGLRTDEPFVCFHIRTPCFRSDAGINNHRNSHIENYVVTLKYLKSQNYQIIRLGDMVKLGFEDLYIDYPNTKVKSELMDLFLLKYCVFFLGTNSGILDTALLLGTPTLAVNVSDFLFVKPYKSCDSFIYKHVISRAKNRKLFFKEVFSEPYIINSNRHFDEFTQHYTLQENTNEEILEAVDNMLSSLKNPCSETPKQSLFKKTLIQAIEKWVEVDPYFQQNPNQAYRVMIKNFFNGRIGRQFSERYFEMTKEDNLLQVK